MARGKVLASAGLFLLGLVALGLEEVWRRQQNGPAWLGLYLHPKNAGGTRPENPAPPADQVSVQALKANLSYPGGPVSRGARTATPTADLNAELTRRGGAGSLFSELGPQGVEELGSSPRYGGRDSGLGINGA